jgi:hypothetical protein
VDGAQTIDLNPLGLAARDFAVVIIEGAAATRPEGRPDGAAGASRTRRAAGHPRDGRHGDHERQRGCHLHVPTPFPNGLYGFQITHASNAVPPTVLGMVMVQAYSAASGASDRTKVALRAYQTSGAVLPSSSIVVNITAFGW